MAGLTSNGLEIKRLNEVINDRITSARNFFGTNAATTENDVLGRAIRIASASEADLWELAEAVYNSFNPSLATGVSLDRVVAYAGLTRFEASPSTVDLLASGAYNTVIPEESFVDSTFTANRFQTTENVALTEDDCSGIVIEVISAVDSTEYTITIGADSFSHTTGTGETRADIAAALVSEINTTSSDFNATVINDVQIDIEWVDIFFRRDVVLGTGNLSFQRVSKLVSAECTVVGPVEQPAETLNVVASPVTGWDEVINPLAANPGRFRETDEELRLRFSQSKELNARGTIDALFSNILGVEGVTEVNVYENVTNGVDALGLPAKSFSAVVLGGSSSTIADVIWQVKPAGIESFGNTTIGVIDSQGLPHDISFSRPQPIDIYIDVTVSAFENQTVPGNIEELIADTLDAYFTSNYGVGDDVIYSRLYTPINNAAYGFQIDSLFIDTSSSPAATSNIVIAYDEIANFTRGNLNVTVN
ncbi:MAG: hypothetical protein CMF22_10630 [Idiomarinaceae bacterium]|nr:hypothetical protein [Idiomarinaceae bacterium]MBG23896.1 hypothetical protein [Idiomarinaceae bacterium]|tara:strand:+ start:5504 stop:6934 length:1431 start_codon:yes stop_codon:yes gene_type:complete